MSRSEYESILASLYAREAAKGMDFKLERVATVLEQLGNPQKRVPAIHVAGTNGKGSVAAMLHSMFSAAGYRVGLYTSPHLVDFRERIRIGAEWIRQDEVADSVRQLESLAACQALTFFELVTVMAWCHFARHRVDLAVIEVGLGGRLDATNVIDPLVSVITTIGFDHEEFLGNTLPSIAREKSGIIKPGRPVVVGDVAEECWDIIADTACAGASPIRRMGRDFEVDGDNSFTYRSAHWTIDALSIGLLGRHQRANAAVAIAALEAVLPRFPLSESVLRSGLQQTRWPGRFELITGRPELLLDGAHNEEGVRTLLGELASVLRGRRAYLLFAVMRDKRWNSMVSQLARRFDGVVTVQVDPRRGVEADVLASACSAYCPAEASETPMAGLARARELAGADGVVVVAGSLFLIGAVYPFILADKRPLPGAFIDCAASS